MDAENPANCWACDVLVQIPIVDGLPAPMYKCGWCGAINELKQPQRFSHTKQALKLLLNIVSFGLRWFVIVFVLCLIAGVVGAGLGVVLPRCFKFTSVLYAHMAFSLVLAFNVLFNYAAAVSRSPGTVSECIKLPSRSNGYFAQHSFEGYTFCRPCKAPKPPGVHHCRACRACVVEMDHHCPFLNNCVGRGNLRPFLLFLLYLIISTLYVLMLCGMLIQSNWSAIKLSALRATATIMVSSQAPVPPLPLDPAAKPNVTSATSSGAAAGPQLEGGAFHPPIRADVPSGAATSTATPGAESTDGTAGAQGSSGLLPGAAAAADNVTNYAEGFTPRKPREAAAAGPGPGPPVAKLWAVGMLLGVAGLVVASPWWLLVTYYLATIALAVFLAVSALLLSQLKYLALGITYVDFIKAGGQGVLAPQPSMAVLRERLGQVFGAGHWMWWLLPRWSAVPGTLAGSNRQKVL